MVGNRNLVTLGLKNNDISTLLDHQFPPLKSLKTIDLSKNVITSVSSKAFSNLVRNPTLATINLMGNKIKTMDEETITGKKEE